MANKIITLDIRWLKKPRYRKFVVVGIIIFTINVFLVYNFLKSYADPLSEVEDPSGRGRYHLEGAFLQDDDENNGDVKSDNIFIKQQKLQVNLEKKLLKQKVPESQLKNYINSNKLNSAIKLSNETSLRIEELDFIPWCNISTKEAISAIHRAKSQYCKKMLVNVTCQLQNKELFPEQLVSSCPTSDMVKGRSLGCFQDDKSLRLLSGYYTNLEQTNSPENCINLCLQSGFPYAGVEYWTECFCGLEAPSSNARLPDSSCNMKCPTDPRLACGGYLTINVYQTGISRLTQVPITSIAKTEPRVRITYLLTISGRALRQVKRLIKCLFHKDHYFYIHVDARQDYLFRELVYLERLLPNVKLMRRRHATMWAGTSLLQMLLAAMKDILGFNWKWDFIINLSESDFPVKQNDKLVEFLTANKGKNFVRATGREIQTFIQKQGLDKTFVECEGHMWKIGDRKLPVGIQFDGGSDWMALSKTFVEYLTSDVRDSLLHGLDRIYLYALLPGESYFHTLLRNSKFCDTYVDNNLHLTNWKRHLGCKCQYKHIVDWCGCSPNDFKPHDWTRILDTSSSHLFFARKFEAIVSQAVINKLEEWVYGPYSDSLNLLGYWQSIYHSADLSPPKDDTVMSLLSGLVRLVCRTNTHVLVNVSDVVEVSSYHHDDVFQGLLVKYTSHLASDRNKTTEMETWFKVKSNFKIIDSANGKFVKNVYVTSDFDMKESISRNLLGCLGPFSEVVLVYSVSVKKSDALTFLVVDPAGQLAQVVEVDLEEKNPLQLVTGSAKITIPTPLMPGTWDVKIYHKGFLVASTEFLVIPLEFVALSPVTIQQASLLHRGSPEYRIAAGKEHWGKSLGNNISKHSMASANQRRTGEDLIKWIDNLVTRFYSPIETCSSNPNLLGVVECEATVWSSLSPDLKSRISSYDSNSGAIS